MVEVKFNARKIKKKELKVGENSPEYWIAKSKYGPEKQLVLVIDKEVCYLDEHVWDSTKHFLSSHELIEKVDPKHIKVIVF